MAILLLTTNLYAGSFTTVTLENSNKPLQQWKESQVPLKVENINIGSAQFRAIGQGMNRKPGSDEFDIRLLVFKTNDEFKPKSTEFIVQLYNDFGDPMLKDGENIIVTQDPNFSTLNTILKGVILKTQPASAKVWIKRYVDSNGKVIVVR